MKYMLIMQATKAEFDSYRAWSPQDLKANIEFMRRFNKELTESGEFVSTEGLAWPEQAKVVRARKDGPPAVTDGPFPEAKEFLAGYWIVDCESPERAVEIAARASAAPGPGGEIGMPIEVRQVMRSAEDLF